MYDYIKALCISATLVFLTFWLALVATSCTPVMLVPAGASTPYVTGASVVTLVRPSVAWAWGSLVTEQGLTDSGFKVSYARSCNGFAISGDRLVTAAHCVAGVDVGGEVRYLSPDGVGHGIATLLSVNEAADLATCEAHGLTPLEVTSPPRDGETTLAVSSYYGQTSYGKVLGHMSTGFYATDFSIIKGWSGSPVLDTRGRVWGVVSRCTLDDTGLECAPGHTFVAALP